MPIIPRSTIPNRPFSVAWNQARDVMRGHEPAQTAGMLTSHTPHGVFREPEQTIYYNNPTESSPGLSLTYCTFVSMGNDLITVRPSGGNVDGSDDIQIVKPYKLRFTITSQTIDGVVIDYSSYSTVNQRRVATVHGTATTEDQIIIPRYLVGDPVYYVSGVTTGVLNDSEQDVGKLEVNIDGRAWGKLYAA